MNHYPVVVLQSKNSSQLATTLEKCGAEGVLYNFFTTTMLSHSSEQQIKDTRETPFAELDFVPPGNDSSRRLSRYPGWDSHEIQAYPL